jgi:hypothetical protein
MFGSLPLVVMNFPSGKYGFVGSIPVVLAEIVPADTPAVMGCRAFRGDDGSLLMHRFPAFNSAAEAVAFAESKGCTVGQVSDLRNKA